MSELPASELDELLDFACAWPTRPLDRQTAGWIIEPIGGAHDRLIDLRDGEQRCVLAAVFDGAGNPAGAAELFVLGFRATPQCEQRFAQVLEWARKTAEQMSVRGLELALAGSLSGLRSVVVDEGYTPAYDLLSMSLDDFDACPWRQFPPAPPLRWAALAEDNIEAAYDCYCRAFATVSGAQVTSLQEFRDMMLIAEHRPRVLLRGAAVLAYVRVVWFNKSQRRGEVRVIARDPAAPEPGLGKAALAEALSQLAQMGAISACLEVASDNERAVGLYRRFGFVVTEATTVYRRSL